MIVAVSADRVNSDLFVSSRFAKSSCFVLFDTNIEGAEVVNNPYAESLGDAGIEFARMLIERNVDAVITDRIGRNSFMVLSAADIRIYRCSEKRVSEATSLFLQGKLEPASSQDGIVRERYRRRLRRRNKN